MRFIVFGTGRFYRDRKGSFPKDVEIIAFVDNNSCLWGKTLDGVAIDNPANVMNYMFDRILLMSKSADEMRQQLLALKVDKKRIVAWSQFEKEFVHRKFYYLCESEKTKHKGRMLIISTFLGYSGGPVMALHAAKALQMNGYDVVLCADAGEKNFIDEIVAGGINVVIYPMISFLGREGVWRGGLVWIEQFDFVLVNTFLKIRCAYEISCCKPTVWWIHECSAKYEKYYPDTIERFAEYVDKIKTSAIDIVGVSSIARDNFNEYFPDCIHEILPYGIPDDGYTPKFHNSEDERIVFAIIGEFCERKGQREFLEAIKMLNNNERKNVEFWFIGKGTNSEYAKDVTLEAEQYEAVKILGELSREKMREMYGKIDVVVCASLEETMSIVLTEGMMHGKVCITTDKTGMAEYIVDRQNGCICEAGNIDSLYYCIKWVLENRREWDSIRMKARETYKRYFTIEKFADRLENTMLAAMGKRRQ